MLPSYILKTGVFMKPNRFRHFLSCFLAFSLLCSCIPVKVSAAGKLPLRELLFAIDFSKLPPLPEDISPEDLLSRLFPSEETLPEETAPEAPSEKLMETGLSAPNLYFGQLHAHSDISDGTGTVEETFQYASGVEGLDFFAVTDHSSFLDNAAAGSIHTDGASLSHEWAAGKAAAAAVTTPNFVGIFGYEMSWPVQMQNGHIGTFNTPGFQSWRQEPYNAYNGALEAYYETLASVPGAIGQFNHPGSRHGTFQDFGNYDLDADRVMNLLEVEAGTLGDSPHYIQALDLGWHVAPTCNQSIHSAVWEDTGARTVICAQSLTEADLYEAMQNCRAYATEDPDLEILYSMNGHFMGSQLSARDIGDSAEISVTLSDATDAAVGTVEVVTGGGEALQSKYLSEPSGTLTFSLPPEPGYYFLRITQPDGDVAITAPVWIRETEAVGISRILCETAIPVQNQPVVLTLELKNGENTDFSVEALEILADGKPVARDDSLTVIPAGSTLSHSLTFSCDCVGITEITARLKGAMKGEARTYEATLTLRFHQSQQVTAIFVDGSHGNAGLEELTILRQMALEENIDLQILEEEATADLLKNCRFFLISAPSRPFSEEFLGALSEFAQSGGSLVVCGQADLQDSGFHSAGELNRLLAAVGSDLEIRDDVVLDLVNNGGSPELLYSDELNLSSPWCQEVSEDQVYRHAPGCSIEGGDWLAKGRSTTSAADGDGDDLGGTEEGNVTLLACEELPGGGSVFAAGCLFCADSAMTEPQNIWDAPYANRTIARNLLGIGGEAVPLSTIREARAGAENQLFRVRGYVTAGTSNPYNTFPDTLYLQDDTGGIAVIPFSETGIQAGTALEVTGYAAVEDGNRVLKPSSWKVLDSDMYLYEALSGSWDYLLDPALCGDVFVQVEGTCLEIYCREDGTLAGCLLKDDNNNLARVKIEDYIFAGSDGENDLHKTIRRGRTVRAMGILHMDEYGDTVIRVRNCEEVVWVPPLRLLNPDTGDSVFLPVIPMVLSFLGLVMLKKRPRRGRYLKRQ